MKGSNKWILSILEKFCKFSEKKNEKHLDEGPNKCCVVTEHWSLLEMARWFPSRHEYRSFCKSVRVFRNKRAQNRKKYEKNTATHNNHHDGKNILSSNLREILAGCVWQRTVAFYAEPVHSHTVCVQQCIKKYKKSSFVSPAFTTCIFAYQKQNWWFVFRDVFGSQSHSLQKRARFVEVLRFSFKKKN